MIQVNLLRGQGEDSDMEWKMLARAVAMVPLLFMSGQGASAPAVKSERRCGWIVNPTPGNWDLVDRDGRWTIGVQGGYQAPGIDDMPDMSTAGWIKDNGSYGHGCACAAVTTSKSTMRITRLISSAPIPLARCRSDRKLPSP